MGKSKKEIKSMFNVLNTELKGSKSKVKPSKKSTSSKKTKKIKDTEKDSGRGLAKVFVFFAVALVFAWMVFMPSGSLKELKNHAENVLSNFMQQSQNDKSDSAPQTTETSIHTTTSTTATTTTTSTTQNTTTRLIAADNLIPSRIDVFLKSQLVVIYNSDDEMIRAFKCSSGKSSTPTRTGNYAIHHQYRWRLMIGNCYSQYASAFSGSYLFHSVPYDKKDASTMYNASYDRLGKPASAGCIRLCCRDAKWIYDNCGIGTKVSVMNKYAPSWIVGESIPPRIKKSKYNGWDPTDPSAKNPYNQ